MDKIQWIRAGWIIDGTGGSVQKDRLLKIRNGRIDSIREYQDSFQEWAGYPDHQRMDLSNCTILPGLVDCHVHLFMSGSINAELRANQLNAEFEGIKNEMDSRIHQFLEHGVLAVRDGGDRHGHAMRYKIRCLDADLHYPILKIVGQAWHKPGRYGQLIGRMLPAKHALGDAIAEDQSKIDHVKIVNSGLNSLTEFGKITQPQFGPDDMQQAVQAAKSKGLRVMVHANGKLPVKFAVEAGCDSIEHGFFMGLDNLKIMAEKHISWVPTAITMKAYAEVMKSNGPEAGIAQKNLDHQLEQLYHARQLHVPVVLGTDSGSPGVQHGLAVGKEMQLLMEAGYSIQEAVRCATSNAAGLLGLENTGCLSPNYTANFIAADGDPSNLPDSLHTPVTVIINGVVYAKE